ncbi:coiled-coil domain-containing protein 181 [Poecile atricapillus]|uniref:coiled-coil domain-containing protein 181 n=1 Tax=Poecile atricapillus TaxID=48891 RepID=UPI00273A1C46|nr:coiled-coil domain-containing protein 181 [Poecile atricapillus]XP_058693883.1 coiled-coil domain-containing protein 181 [Poecile atricapillus]
MGDVTENTEYEDDFEKDLECLTDEEEKQNLGEKKNPGKKEEDVEAQIHKAAYSSQEDNEEVEESLDQLSEADVNVKMIYANEKYFPEANIEQKGHESDERESFIQECKLENEQELEEDEDMKRYVLEKIEEANKNLENQTPVDQNRERKLKFKDEMDIKVPPPKDADLARGDDVSIGLSQLHISDDTGQKHTLSEGTGSDEEMTGGKVLVEKDGKFELLSLCDIESQGILPPISVSFSDIETQRTAPKSSLLTDPSPPSDSKQPPDPASNGAKDLGKQKTESANTATKTSTYTLTPKQKELRKQIEIRNEILRREEEDRKRELEEMRRRENEIVYKAWLQKKKVQLKEEKRIRRAKQLEELRMKDVNRDPEEAYRLWLKKKHQQYMKEKRIEFLRRQTEEVAFVPRAEECDRAFRDWLRRKKEEKQEAELAAKERGRLFKLEARRARQMRSMHYI